MSWVGAPVRPLHGSLATLLLASTALVSASAAYGQALPTGGTVASGGVTIATPSATQMTINQSTGSAVVNWQSFSVGAGATVNIVQPSSSSALLNRVTGNTQSTIAGQINANGQVFLVNPNGIAITPTGTVNAAGFVASTLGISDEDFNAGRRTFTGSGSSAAVSNAGAINIGRGGYAALIGGSVDNAGTISVPLGRVGLGSGEQATLDLSGDGFLQVALPTKTQGNGALVTHSGRISADGGRVEIRAAQARDAVRQAVNLSGVVEARSVSGRQGEIILGGGDGAVTVTGRLDVSTRQRHASQTRPARPTRAAAPATGGRITVTARTIDMRGAALDASGRDGGGQIRIGGDYQGTGTLQRAETTTIDAATTIRADALRSGNGGRVIVWSDLDTRFAGLITARGGAQGGDGGFAEVSGKARLGYTGFTDLSAVLGRFGDLLLDPYDVTISNGVDANQSGFSATGNNSVINVTTLQNALAGANVKVTTGAGGAQSGDITVANSVTWTSPTTLTLSAYRNITVNAGVSISNSAGGAGLVLQSDATGTGTGTVSLLGTVSLANGTTRIYYNTANYAAPTDYSAASTGPTTAYMLVNTLSQLQAMATNSGGNYALGRDIDATVTSGWNGGAGFVPIGQSFGTEYSGNFDGQGHKITNLTINRPTEDNVGLFGLTWQGSVSNVSVIGGSIAGNQYTGTVIGRSMGTIVTGVSSSAAVSGGYNTGGLVGMNEGVGKVSQSYATGSVTASSGSQGVGGLVGTNRGRVEQSYATGTVNGASSFWAGGLVGTNYGVVTQSYATGTVNGNWGAGGLVGWNAGGAISQSYSTGAVSAANYLGGLVGTTNAGGTTTNSYWNVQTSGLADSDGGAGLTTAQMQVAANFVGFDPTVWAPANASYRPELFGVSGVVGVSGAATRYYGDANPTDATYYGAGRWNTITTAVSYSTTATITSGVGSYSTSVGTGAVGSFANGGATRFVYLSGGQLTVAARPLTVTASAATRGYGDANPALTYLLTSGSLVNGDTLSGSLATSANGTSGVGAYAITMGSLAASSNYAITYVGANLTVTPRAITVTANTASRDYGDANPAFTYGVTAGSLINGDTLGGALASAATATSNVGSYGITQGTLANANYAITYVGGNLTVSARAVTVTANTASRAYGDANPVFTFTTTSLGAGAALTGTLASVANGTSAVGSYGITQGTVTTANNPNYVVSYSGANLTVTQRAITVTANAASRAYGDANPVFTYGVTSGSLVNGDTLSGALATSATATSNVGLYGITQGTLAASSNYAVTYAGANLTVTQRAITVTADAASRAYGDANPAFTYGVTSGSLVNGDTLSGALTTSATATSNVGLYGITQGTLAASSNYAVTYAGANLSVGQRAITVTANGASRAYGDANPTLTYGVTSGSLVNGDTLTGALTTSATATSDVGLYGITQGTLAASSNYAVTYAGANLTVSQRAITVTANAAFRDYGDTNPAFTYGVTSGSLVNGDTLSGALATSATATSNVGLYGITQGTLAASSNYAVTYAGASLTVNQRAVTVTANALSRAYGDANPVLTFTTTSLGAGAALTGTLATTADGSSAVGAYGITQGTVTTANNPNYLVSYAGANLTVTQRAITVTADAASRTYGDTNPAFTYGVTSGSLVNGDTLSGALTTSATATSNVGLYGITQGTLAASSNYAVTYAGANLTVNQRAITVTANAASRDYGDANPTFTYGVTSGSLVNGDTLSGALATSATATSNVGLYGITQGTLAASSNYAVTYAGASLTVNQRAITVTANAASRVYGDANPAFSYGVTSGSLVNGDSLTGGFATSATATSDVGSYGITQGTLAASSNYALTVVGANLTITQRAITITANDLSRLAGQPNPPLTYGIGGRGLVNGDSLSGELATSATATSGPGSYAITQGSLVASANYLVTFQAGSLSVTPAGASGSELASAVDWASRANSIGPASLYAMKAFAMLAGAPAKGLVEDPRFNGSMVCLGLGSAACFATP
ncbi:MAG: filamentous hemagglutinin N-terminal domain-containing protein [Rhizobiales bacterium]|nr:filamentous hemagglutinin N-terminal domain-containing protein [Hyphomicrobiales bacterium]